MKGGQNLRDLQQKRKEEEGWVREQPCHICKKVLRGAYGHTNLAQGVVWSCSGTCEKEVQRERKAYYASTGVQPPTQAQTLDEGVA